jgi:hypothetical protein
MNSCARAQKEKIEIIWDIMTEYIKNYPIALMMALNHGKQSVGSELQREAQKYGKITDLYKDVKYNNTHNPNFKNSSTDEVNSKHGVIQRAEAFSPERIVEDVRKMINQINSTNTSSSISKLNGAKLDEISEGKIAELFLHAMVNSIFLLPSYVNVFLNISNSSLSREELNRQLLTQIFTNFKTPPKFTDTERETGAQIEARWRVGIAVIISYLYDREVDDILFQKNFSTRLVTEKFLDVFFRKIEESHDDEAIEIVSQVWKNIKRRLAADAPETYVSLKERLSKFSKSKEIKTTSRIKLIGLD